MKYITDNAEIANNIWTAKQTNTSVNILRKLAEHESIIVRLAVAKNSNTPGEAIEQLWQKEGNYLISRASAKHPNTPKQVLQEFMPSVTI